MAGHSHAKNVKLRKSAVDAKRSKLFSKLARLIIIAARAGGDPKTNAKLAFAITKAKSYSVSRDTIENAIKKGTGELQSDENFEEIAYEGYGPGGVAVICEILTENRNRTAGEVRKIFEVSGGKMGTTGCVGYMFQRRGQIFVDANGRSEDDLMEIVLEAGASDLRRSGESFEILCEPSAFENVESALIAKGINPTQSEIVQIADTLVKVEDPDIAKRIVKLLDTLDEHNDVQNVFSNADLPDSAYADE